MFDLHFPISQRDVTHEKQGDISLSIKVNKYSSGIPLDFWGKKRISNSRKKSGSSVI